MRGTHRWGWQNTDSMAKQCIDEVLLVKEDTIKEAVVSLLENE